MYIENTIKLLNETNPLKAEPVPTLPDKLEVHTYDEWYTNFINQSNGIWVGNGIENQTLINTNFSINGIEQFIMLLFCLLRELMR